MTDKTKTVPAQRQLDEDLNSQASARAVTNTTGELLNDVRDTAPKPGPSPAWCTDEPGHDYDSIASEGATYIRFHSGHEHLFDRADWEREQPSGLQKRSPGVVQVSALEESDGTTVTLTRPTITIWDGHEDLTTSDAVRLAMALCEAIDESLHITEGVPYVLRHKSRQEGAR